MAEKNFRVHFEISVTTGKLDSFKSDVYLTMSDEEKNWASEAGPS